MLSCKVTKYINTKGLHTLVYAAAWQHCGPCAFTSQVLLHTVCWLCQMGPTAYTAMQSLYKDPLNTTNIDDIIAYFG